MRVSDTMIQQFLLRANRDAKSALLAASEQVTSGSAFQTIADAPREGLRVLSIDRMLSRLDALDASRLNVARDLEMADMVLFEVEDSLSQLRTLVLGVVNGDTSDSDYSAASVIAQATMDTLLSRGNSRQADAHYIFAGTADQDAPFDDAGLYVGNADGRRVEIAPGVFVDAALNGEAIFGAVDLGPNAGMNAMQVVQNVIDALDAQDTTALQAAMDDLDDVFNDVVTVHAGIGAQLNILTDSEILVQDVRLALANERSNLADADLTAAALDVTSAQQLLSLVGQLGSQLTQNSLITFLG